MFCAVELPPEVKEHVGAHVARLRGSAAPGAKASWERPEKLHLTVKFIGEIDEAQVESLSHAAERASSGVEPFRLSLEGTGAFPTRGLARVLWLGVADASGRLARLHARLEDECTREGFPRERREFSPHLTLARLRVPAGARELAALHKETDFEPVSFPVTQLKVIRSELGPDGSRYTTVTSHELKAPSQRD